MNLPTLKERRLYLRHQVDMPANLSVSNSSSLKINISNLSLKGMLFHCDEYISRKIEPRGIQNHPLDHIQFTVSAELANHTTLQVIGRIVIARRVSQDKYLIGMEFIEFQKDSFANLESYISSLDD